MPPHLLAVKLSFLVYFWQLAVTNIKRPPTFTSEGRSEVT